MFVRKKNSEFHEIYKIVFKQKKNNNKKTNKIVFVFRENAKIFLQMSFYRMLWCHAQLNVFHVYILNSKQFNK